MLANNLKRLRKIHHLTQDELADILNVDRSAVSKWEREINEPSVSQLAKIAEHFKISVDELTGVKKNSTDDIEKLKRFIDNNELFSKKNITILLVPIINIALLLSIIVSLLVVLVPTYNGYNNQDNDGKLIYSNIESVSLLLYVPNELPRTINFHKSSNPFNPKYYLNDLDVIVYDNPAEINELYTLFTIIVVLRNKATIDLPRTGKLIIDDEDKYLFHKKGDLYFCISESGVYDIEFYIENEMGYIGTYLSS